MKKSKIFAIVLSLVMAFTLFAIVGCDNSDPVTNYSVIFKDGETEVKTVTVEAGTALSEADIPASPEKTGFTFVGWFDGETEIKAGTTINADTTAFAKYAERTYEVNFKVNGEVVKTATVKDGEKLATADVPTDPEIAHYAFGGWFIDGDPEKPFNPATSVVTGNLTVIADMSRTEYVATFMNGDTEIKVSVIAIGSKLTSNDIPGSLQGGADETWLGWYSGVTKATVDLVLEEDMTFTAAFVSEESYSGAWYNDEDCVMAVFGADKKVNALGKTNKTYEYKADGSAVFTDGTYSSTKTYTMVAIGDIMAIDCTYWDGMEEVNVTESYTLTKGEAVDYAGKYYRDNMTSNYVNIIDGGVIDNYNSSSMFYARLIENDGSYIVKCRKYESSEPIVGNAEFDNKGNLFISNGEDVFNNSDKGLFVKDVTAVNSYNQNSEKYFCVFTFADGGNEYVYYANGFDSYEYVTVDGTVAQGEIVTLTTQSGKLFIKIINSNIMEVAGAERGTYSCGNVSIELDGFGNAKKISDSTEEYSYYMVGSTAVLIIDLEGADFEGYTLSGNQATVKNADGYQSKYQNQRQYYTNYYVYFDGFGGVIDKISSSFYYGQYAIDGDNLTVTGGVYHFEKGDYTFKQNGDVILPVKANSSNWYLKAGAVVDTHISDFEGENSGWWQNDADSDDYVSIDISAGKITFNGKTSSYTASWNGTSLRVGHPMYITVTVVNGKLNIIVDNSTDVLTYTSAPEPVIEKDGFEGTYTANIGSSNVAHVFYIDGYGNVYDDKTASTYTVDGNKVKFSVGGFDYIFTMGTTISLSFEQDYDSIPVSNVKKNDGLDAFAGRWEKSDKSIIVTFTGKGVAIVEDDGKYIVNYTLNGNVAKFSANWNDWTCTVSGNSFEAVVLDLDGYTQSEGGTYTKEITGAMNLSTLS